MKIFTNHLSLFWPKKCTLIILRVSAQFSKHMPVSLTYTDSIFNSIIIYTPLYNFSAGSLRICYCSDRSQKQQYNTEPFKVLVKNTSIQVVSLDTPSSMSVVRQRNCIKNFFFEVGKWSRFRKYSTRVHNHSNFNLLECTNSIFSVRC